MIEIKAFNSIVEKVKTYIKDDEETIFEQVNFFNELLQQIIEQNNLDVVAKLFTLNEYSLMTYEQAISPIVFHLAVKSNRQVLFNEQALQKKKSKRQQLLERVVGSSIGKGQTSITRNEICEILVRCLAANLDETDFIFSKFGNVYITREHALNVVIYVDYVFENDNVINFNYLTINSEINLENFIENFNNKNLETNYKYSLFVSLFKAFEYELFLKEVSAKYFANKYFLIESLLFNVPSNLFLNENDELVYKQIINYLNLCNIDKWHNIDGQPLFNDKSIYSKKEIINAIKRQIHFYKNFDNLIK